MAGKVVQYQKPADAAQKPSVLIVAGHVLQQVSAVRPAMPIGGSLMDQRASRSTRSSLAEGDPKLMKAKFLVTNDHDGATTTHTVYLDREQIGRASATGLTMLLGRLTGNIETNRIFFLRGSLQLADGSALPFVETAFLRRYASGGHLLTVEALLV